jgi:pimeloyl-ACP methyl ester carboxylesterase
MKCKLISLLQLIVVTFAASGGTIDTVNRISEERFLKINGKEQWVTIKGDITKPVVLFIHGGPGSPMSPYADAIYGDWEKDFVLVQWDQRGTARTYGRNAPPELTPEYLQSTPLTLEQMTADGIELSQYLLKYLRKQKLILFGSSWGSALGVRIVQSRPELFYAYIGHSQLVNPAASDISAYSKIIELATESNDHASLDMLRHIGKPPYDTARNAGKFIRVLKKYQQKKALPPPASWFVPASEYENEKDDFHRREGDDYSFVNYVGDKRLGITSISATINFFKDGLEFKIPVFFIQGEEDIQTPAAITKTYFDQIKAPLKKFILLPQTEHGFNKSVIESHFTIMKNDILPVIGGK